MTQLTSLYASTDAGPAKPHSSRTRIVISIIGCMSLIATILSFTIGEKIAPNDPPTGRDTLSQKGLGHKGYMQALAALGFRVQTLHQPEYSQSGWVAFLEPENSIRVDGTTYELKDVVQKRRDANRPTLVVLPKWLPKGKVDTSTAVESVMETGVLTSVGGAGTTVRKAGSDFTVQATELLTKTSTQEFTIHVAKGLQCIDKSAMAMAPVSYDVQGALLVKDDCVIAYRSGSLVVLAEPDLIHNFAFASEDNMALSLALVLAIDAPKKLGIDEVFHGHARNYSLGAALGTYPLSLFPITALAVAVLLVWAGARRLGLATQEKQLRRGNEEILYRTAMLLSLGQPAGTTSARAVRAFLRDVGRKLGLHAESHQKKNEPHATEYTRDVSLALAIDTYAQRRRLAPEARGILEESHRIENDRAFTAAAGSALYERARTFAIKLGYPAKSTSAATPKETRT